MTTFEVPDTAEAPLTGKLVVASMCHCDEPDECDDHWEFFVDPVMSEDGEHARLGRHLSPSEMRYIARVVNGPDLGRKEAMTVRDDVLAVNYLMREPITGDECDRVIHALGLVNYEIKKRSPEKGVPRSPLTKGLIPGEGKAPKNPPAPSPRPRAGEG